MSTANTTSPVPGVGDPCPTWLLPSTIGDSLGSRGLKGKRYVIYAYPKADTPGCTREACDFRDALTVFAGAGVVVIGLSPDPLPRLLRFAEKHALTFPLVSDPERAFLRAIGAWGEKVLYGRRSEGVIRSTLLVDAKGRIEALWRGVKVPGHVAAVQAAAGLTT